MVKIIRYRPCHLITILSKQRDLYGLNFSNADEIITPSFISGIADMYQSNASNAFVLDVNGRVGGFYIAGYYPQHDGSRLFTLAQIYVNTEYRGMGYGKLMLDHFEELAKKTHNENIVVLDVSAMNKQVVRFYERNGYQSAHVKFEDNELRICMHKSLTMAPSFNG